MDRAILEIPRSIANDLDRVLWAASERCGLGTVEIRNDREQVTGYLLTPAEFTRLREAAGDA
jgi:hypothetical protein